MSKATQARDAYEAAHPHVRRRREAYAEMATKVAEFLDIPAKLPVRSHTPAELALLNAWRKLNNLREHVRWRGVVHRYQSQAPVPVAYINL